MKIKIPETSLVIIDNNDIKRYFKQFEISETINEVEAKLNKNQLVVFCTKERLAELFKLAKKYNMLTVGIMSNDSKKEQFNCFYNFNELSNIEIIKTKLPCNLKNEKGPFDIIGDVHGCFLELILLIKKLGYEIQDNYNVLNPQGRKLIFVGDYVDRGPKIVEVLKLVMRMTSDNKAICVIGNHDDKLLRWLKGRNVKIQHGLEDSVEQLEKTTSEFKQEVYDFLDNLESHYVLDSGNLVIAHAGMKEKYQGRVSKRIRSFAMFGDTTNEIDQFGLPIRKIWAKDYLGKAKVIYGHTPNLNILKLNNTINIDTGCVFGNKLTAYRYPEDEIVSVNALSEYSRTKRPIK